MEKRSGDWREQAGLAHNSSGSALKAGPAGAKRGLVGTSGALIWDEDKVVIMRFDLLFPNSICFWLNACDEPEDELMSIPTSGLLSLHDF